MSSQSDFRWYTGRPHLEQLYLDLRAAELFREAPRLSVPEREYKAMFRDCVREGGKIYTFVDDRKSRSVESSETTLSSRSLGSFKLESGALAFLVLHPPNECTSF